MRNDYEAPTLVELGPADALVLGTKNVDVTDGIDPDFHAQMSILDAD